ncbi:MAG: hypothetical protein ABFR32_09590 [Bacteroidota bacterium]
MKKNRSYLSKKPLNIVMITGCLFFLLLACGNNSDKKNNTLKSGIQIKEKQNNDSNIDCFEKYHGKPEELLTKELVGKYVDFEGADVDIAKVSEQIIKDKDFAQVNCKWKINRQRHIVRLKQISKIELYESKNPVDRFYDKYHTRTPEERTELKKLYDSLVLNSDKVKQKTDKSTAEMVSESIGFDFKYLTIKGIGDAAVWEYKVNDLKVLVGDFQFTVNVDLNKGNDYDLEKAKLIAKAIIEKACN